jgi:hypothetical protein
VSSDAEDYAAPSTPKRKPAGKGKTKTSDDLQGLIRTAFTAARSYSESDLAPFRTKATDFYHGEKFGNEVEGRSQVIMRDVRDTVIAYMPTLMRIFFGGRRVVEYLPQKEADTKLAEQATDYINEVVVAQDNRGYLAFHSAFKDALIRRTGIFKWWWDDRRKVSYTQHSGLTQEQLTALGDDPETTKLQVERDDSNPADPRFSVVVRREQKQVGVVRFACVPNEEFYYTPGTPDMETALAVFHSRLISVNDAVAMGYDRETVLEKAETTAVTAALAGSTSEAMEKMARRPGESGGAESGIMDEDSRSVRYTEGYTRCDMDGDGYAELMKVCGLGEPMDVVAHEPVDEIPFSVISPDPEPHELAGGSVSDLTMDIQLVKSSAARYMLDAFAQSVNPGYEAVEGHVNLEDLQNNELSRIVRVDAPGMLRELQITPTGQQMFGVLQYFDTVREDRTKQSQASQGLNADALQSTTQSAIAATMSAAQGNQELVARNFAETGIKDLFRGLLRLVCRHQDQKRTVLLRGEWVEIDPRSWNAEMQVAINVGIGSGGIDEKRAALEGIAQQQKDIIQFAGVANPIAGAAELSNTLSDLAVLAGRRNASRYFKAVPADWQPPAQPQGSDAASQLAQVQREELQQRMAIEQAKLQLEREKMLLDDQRERVKIALDFRANIAKANGMAKQTTDATQADLQAQQYATEIEAQTRVIEAQFSTAAQMHGNAMQAASDVHATDNQPTPAPAAQ